MYDALTGFKVFDASGKQQACKNPNVNYMDGVIPTNVDVAEATFSGLVFEDLLTFSFKDTGEVKFRDTAICSVNNAQFGAGSLQSFKGPGDASGLIGLGPYTADVSTSTMNFMSNLITGKHIEHNVFALYLDYFNRG